MVPFSEFEKPKTEINSDKVCAIILFHEPLEWRSSLQVILDLLLSDGHVSSDNYSKSDEQQVALYIANPDFEFLGNYGAPRLTSGAFLHLLKTLFKAKTGMELKYHVYGKPFPEVYTYAQDFFHKQNKNIRTYYAVGDNPLSDIKGANQAKWYSILVRTGVWQQHGKKNDEENPAKFVCENVLEAVDHILQITTTIL